VCVCVCVCVVLHSLSEAGLHLWPQWQYFDMRVTQEENDSTSQSHNRSAKGQPKVAQLHTLDCAWVKFLRLASEQWYHVCLSVCLSVCVCVCVCACACVCYACSNAWHTSKCVHANMWLLVISRVCIFCTEKNHALIVYLCMCVDMQVMEKCSKVQ